MVTAEGKFPKIGNDPVYNSEINRFAGAGQLIFMGSFIDLVSSTEFQDFGSVVINPGSLTNPCQINGLFRLGATGGGDILDMRVRLSGLSANTFVGGGSNIGGLITKSIEFNSLIGNPFNGLISAKTVVADGAYRATGGAQQIKSFNNLHTGSTVVILFEGRTNSADANIRVSLQSFRGSLNENI